MFHIDQVVDAYLFLNFFFLVIMVGQSVRIDTLLRLQQELILLEAGSCATKFIVIVIFIIAKPNGYLVIRITRIKSRLFLLNGSLREGAMQRCWNRPTTLFAN
jgi:hypothetical protein